VPEPEDHELVLPDIGCFGCSHTRTDGLRMRFRRRGDRVVSEHAIPAALHGPPGTAHGGIEHDGEQLARATSKIFRREDPR
jgi:hypothetical protein